MRVLITMPHFYRPKADAFHGSEKADFAGRLAALKSSLISLYQTFGRGQSHIERPRSSCNDRVSFDLDVVICTTGDSYLVNDLPSYLFIHHRTQASPKLLGYACHEVLAGKPRVLRLLLFYRRRPPN